MAPTKLNLSHRPATGLTEAARNYRVGSYGARWPRSAWPPSRTFPPRGHAEDPPAAAHVKQQQCAPKQSHHRPVKQGNIANAPTKPQLSGTKAPERQGDPADRVGGEVNLDGKQKIRNHQAHRDEGIHV